MNGSMNLPRYLAVIKALGLASAIALTGCQSLPGTHSADNIGLAGRIASLKPADLEPVQARFTEVEPTLDVLIENYSQLLPLLLSPDEKLRVLHRLADLKLARGEELMVDEAIDELGIAISAYQGLLQKYPERAVNDQVHYQLARSYELQGRADLYLAELTTLAQRYPASRYISEVQFRRGEALFAQGRYPEAQAAFAEVIAQPDTSFLLNAYYMRGWSLFKQSQFEWALLDYLAVLDVVLEDSSKIEDVDSQYRSLVDDMFRVMGLSFNYLGGADALEDLFAKTGPREYEILVYDHYADLLIDKQQYSDALAVFERYIALHPLSLWAPVYQVKIIDTLAQAGFNSDILEEKIRFVDEYGVGTEFWDEHTEKRLGFVRSQLEKLIPELAQHFYLRAQNLESSAKKDQARQAYARAADYYERFVAAFANAPQTPESYFFLGESRLKLALLPEAIAAFEAAGYQFSDYRRDSEAAYAAIVAYQDYAKTWRPEADFSAEDIAEKRGLQQQNRLLFVNRHSADERADDVLYSATDYAYTQSDFTQALALAERLLSWQPQPNKTLRREASLIKAHALYGLEDYLRAERAYVQALTQVSAKDTRRKALVENLAASVYRQGEQRLAAGDARGAIDEWLRVAAVAPSSSLRVSAEFDAIGQLLLLKDWQGSIEQIGLFRTRYPKHAKLDSLVPKMALAYRETEQWELAGDEVQSMIRLAKTEQERQDSYYIAAELYDRAGNTGKAISAFRSYANRYAEPAAQYMEAAQRLAELYDKQDEQLKRRFWLAKQMKTVDRVGRKADERMVYLAASASAVLANDAFIQYQRIKLKLPLNVSMQNKTRALEKAMAAYQKTASYGLSSFATEAGYRMADIYAQLSRDLMDSDRPEGLDELELEQYEILLEEQAFPFEDSAIDIHEQNASRAWSGIYDSWVKDSFTALKQLLPGRYNKPEQASEIVTRYE